MPLNCALRNGSRGEFYIIYISYHNQAKTSQHWAHILALLIGCVTLTGRVSISHAVGSYAN